MEPDGDLALATVHACLEVGLEPRLCRGVENIGGDCPGLHGECPTGMRSEASLIVTLTDEDRRAAPSCVRGRWIEATDQKYRVPAGAPVPEARLDYPYDPRAAADLLLRMVTEARHEGAST